MQNPTCAPNFCVMQVATPLQGLKKRKKCLELGFKLADFVDGHQEKAVKIYRFLAERSLEFALHSSPKTITSFFFNWIPLIGLVRVDFFLLSDKKVIHIKM